MNSYSKSQQNQRKHGINNEGCFLEPIPKSNGSNESNPEKMVKQQLNNIERMKSSLAQVQSNIVQ